MISSDFDLTTQAGRAEYIAAMERKMALDRQKFAEAKYRYEAYTEAMNQAMRLYIDTVTAPLRAFAEELRK